MRVAFHSDSFARRESFGLARYSREMRRALSGLGVQLTPFSTQSDFGTKPPPWLQATGFARIPVPRRYLATTWTFLRIPMVEWMLPTFDVLHSVDVDYAAPTRKAWVTTFHDLGPLIHPQYFSNAVPWLLERYVRMAVKRADAIICVSESTASELRSIASSPLGDRVHVIPGGISDEFLQPQISPEGGDEEMGGLVPEGPFFLFCGSMNPRKNLRRVLRAFMRTCPLLPHHLVITGVAGWDAKELLSELEDSRSTGRVHTPGYVSDTALRALLRRASAFLYPSLYEGFGLPILEAMACGCPVLTSSIPPMSDVAGGAALLVEPSSDDEIADGIVKLASDEHLRAMLIDRGLRWSRGFTWTASAQRVADLYSAVV